MLSFLKTLNINCDRHTRLHLVFTRALHRVGQAHRELLQVCRTRDPEQASAALWKHITEAGEYLRVHQEPARASPHDRTYPKKP